MLTVNSAPIVNYARFKRMIHLMRSSPACFEISTRRTRVYTVTPRFEGRTAYSRNGWHHAIQRSRRTLGPRRPQVVAVDESNAARSLSEETGTVEESDSPGPRRPRVDPVTHLRPHSGKRGRTPHRSPPRFHPVLLSRPVVPLPRFHLSPTSFHHAGRYEELYRYTQRLEQDASCCTRCCQLLDLARSGSVRYVRVDWFRWPKLALGVGDHVIIAFGLGPPSPLPTIVIPPTLRVTPKAGRLR